VWKGSPHPVGESDLPAGYLQATKSFELKNVNSAVLKGSYSQAGGRSSTSPMSRGNPHPPGESELSSGYLQATKSSELKNVNSAVLEAGGHARAGERSSTSPISRGSPHPPGESELSSGYLQATKSSELKNVNSAIFEGSQARPGGRSSTSPGSRGGSPSPRQKNSPSPGLRSSLSPGPKRSPSPISRTKMSPVPKDNPSPIPKSTPSPLPRSTQSPVVKGSPSPVTKGSPVPRGIPSPTASGIKAPVAGSSKSPDSQIGRMSPVNEISPDVADPHVSVVSEPRKTSVGTNSPSLRGTPVKSENSEIRDSPARPGSSGKDSRKYSPEIRSASQASNTSVPKGSINSASRERHRRGDNGKPPLVENVLDNGDLDTLEHTGSIATKKDASSPASSDRSAASRRRKTKTNKGDNEVGKSNRKRVSYPADYLRIVGGPDEEDEVDTRSPLEQEDLLLDTLTAYQNSLEYTVNLDEEPKSDEEKKETKLKTPRALPRTTDKSSPRTTDKYSPRATDKSSPRAGVASGPSVSVSGKRGRHQDELAEMDTKVLPGNSESSGSFEGASEQEDDNF